MVSDGHKTTMESCNTPVLNRTDTMKSVNSVQGDCQDLVAAESENEGSAVPERGPHASPVAQPDVSKAYDMAWAQQLVEKTNPHIEADDEYGQWEKPSGEVNIVRQEHEEDFRRRPLGMTRPTEELSLLEEQELQRRRHEDWQYMAAERESVNRQGSQYPNRIDEQRLDNPFSSRQRRQ